MNENISANKCPFCCIYKDFIERRQDEKGNTTKRDVLIDRGRFFVIFDSFPASPGHMLIITKDHRRDFFQLTEDELRELGKIIVKAKLFLEENGHSPDGYNVGMNCGRYAGQTVMHFHCHLIPRYKGDVDDPRGGVRYCIPHKGKY